MSTATDASGVTLPASRLKLILWCSIATMLVGSACGIYVMMDKIDTFFSYSSEYRHMRVKRAVEFANNVIYVDDMYRHPVKGGRPGLYTLNIKCRWQHEPVPEEYWLAAALFDSAGNQLDDAMWYVPTVDKVPGENSFTWEFRIKPKTALPGKFKVTMTCARKGENGTSAPRQEVSIVLPNVSWETEGHY